MTLSHGRPKIMKMAQYENWERLVIFDTDGTTAGLALARENKFILSNFKHPQRQGEKAIGRAGSKLRRGRASICPTMSFLKGLATRFRTRRRRAPREPHRCAHPPSRTGRSALLSPGHLFLPAASRMRTVPCPKPSTRLPAISWRATSAIGRCH